MYTDSRPVTIKFVNVGPLAYNLINGGNCDPAYFTFSSNFYTSSTVESLAGSPGWRIYNDSYTFTYKSYSNGNITWLLEVTQLNGCSINSVSPNFNFYSSEVTAPIGASSVTFPFAQMLGGGFVIINFSSGSTTTTTTNAPGGGGSSTSTNAFCAKITSVNDDKIEVDIDDCENALGGFNKTITICHGCNSSKLTSGFSEKTIAICDLQGKSVNYVFLVKNADTKSPKPSISLCECTCSKPTTTTTSSPPNCGTLLKLCAENFGNYESYVADSLNGEWDIDSSCSSGGKPCYKKITGQGTFWIKHSPSSSGQLRWSISSSINPSIPLVLFADCPEGNWHAENSTVTLGKTAKGNCPITPGACPDKLCGTGFADTQPAGNGLWIRATNSNKASWGLSTAIHNGRSIYVKTGLYMWYAGESLGQYTGLIYNHWKITNSQPGNWVGDSIKLEIRSYPTGAYGNLDCPLNTAGNQWVYEAITLSGVIHPDTGISGPCAVPPTTTTTTTTTTTANPCSIFLNTLTGFGPPLTDAIGSWTLQPTGGSPTLVNGSYYWSKFSQQWGGGLHVFKHTDGVWRMTSAFNGSPIDQNEVDQRFGLGLYNGFETMTKTGACPHGNWPNGCVFGGLPGP